MLKLITVGVIALSSALVSSFEIFASPTSSKKFLSESGSFPNFKTNGVNNRPLIGVLTQPLTQDQQADPRFKGKTSYIMASYINYLESAGARTVPLLFDGDLETELAKMDNLNGVFFCGGGADGPYDVFGKAVYEKAKQMNDNGNYMPVWGTCLGFENLAMFASDDSDTVLGRFDSNDESYNITYTVDPTETRMF